MKDTTENIKFISEADAIRKICLRYDEVDVTQVVREKNDHGYALLYAFRMENKMNKYNKNWSVRDEHAALQACVQNDKRMSSIRTAMQHSGYAFLPLYVIHNETIEGEVQEVIDVALVVYPYNNKGQGNIMRFAPIDQETFENDIHKIAESQYEGGEYIFRKDSIEFGSLEPSLPEAYLFYQPGTGMGACARSCSGECVAIGYIRKIKKHDKK